MWGFFTFVRPPHPVVVGLRLFLKQNTHHLSSICTLFGVVYVVKLNDTNSRLHECYTQNYTEIIQLYSFASKRFTKRFDNIFFQKNVWRLKVIKLSFVNMYLWMYFMVLLSHFVRRVGCMRISSV